jgi:hypothetical protein
MNGFLWIAIAFAVLAVMILASMYFGKSAAVSADNYGSLVSGVIGIGVCGGIAIVLATVGL